MNYAATTGAMTTLRTFVFMEIFILLLMRKRGPMLVEKRW